MIKCLTNKLIETTQERKGGIGLEKEAPKLTKKTRLEFTPTGSRVDNAAIQGIQESAALKKSSTCC